MNAKIPKKSSGNDIKTTIIVILIAVVAIQAFMLFHKGKAAPKPAAYVSAPSVIKPSKPVSGEPSAFKPLLPVKKAAPGSAGKIAFILDDWGYTTHNCKYLKAIKEPLAVAILPGL